jgi:type I restriction enzyme S subunit
MSHHKPYGAYMDSGSEWLGSIPKHWEVKRLRHLASFANSNVDKKSHDGEQDVRLCNYTDVYYNESIHPGLDFMPATASKGQAEAFGLRAGDVIITKDSEDPRDIGIPAFVPETIPGVVCGYHLTLIRANLPQAAQFIFRAIQSHPSKGYFHIGAPGITRFGLGQDVIGDLPVALPPLPELARITDWIQSETARIDALIEKKTLFIGLLKLKRQSLITNAVIKGIDFPEKLRDSRVEWIGAIPDHWTVMRMGNIYRETNRTGDPTLPVLSISIHDGISDDELAQEDRDRRVSHIEDREKYKRVVPGDLAYNMMRAWQGGFGAVMVDGLVSPAYVVAEPTCEIRSDFVELLLRTPMAIEEMRRFSRGIADFRMRLYWDDFKNIRVCLPPVEEQNRILEFIAKASSRIDLLAERTQESITLLKERRTALITAAVTGQIDLREDIA